MRKYAKLSLNYHHISSNTHLISSSAGAEKLTASSLDSESDDSNMLSRSDAWGMRSTSLVRLPLTGWVPGVVGGDVRDDRSEITSI